MTCPSCLAIIPLSIGIGLSINKSYIIGSLITIISLCLYLHYKEFSKCSLCSNT